MRRELKIFGAFAVVFVVAYALPLGNPKIQAAIQYAFRLLQWYARNHTLAFVVPALFTVCVRGDEEDVLKFASPL